MSETEEVVTVPTADQVMQEKVEEIIKDLRDRSESVDPISSSEVFERLATLSLSPEDREDIFEISMMGYYYNHGNCIRNAAEWFLVATEMKQHCY